MAEQSTAYIDGWNAHRLGVRVEDNPYSETTQAYSNSQWLSGWCRRFGAVKHGEDTAELDDKDGLE